MAFPPWGCPVPIFRRYNWLGFFSIDCNSRSNCARYSAICSFLHCRDRQLPTRRHPQGTLHPKAQGPAQAADIPGTNGKLTGRHALRLELVSQAIVRFDECVWNVGVAERGGFEPPVEL